MCLNINILMYLLNSQSIISIFFRNISVYIQKVLQSSSQCWLLMYSSPKTNICLFFNNLHWFFTQILPRNQNCTASPCIFCYLQRSMKLHSYVTWPTFTITLSPSTDFPQLRTIYIPNVYLKIIDFRIGMIDSEYLHHTHFNGSVWKSC